MVGLKVLAEYRPDTRGYERLRLEDGSVVDKHRYLMANLLGRELDTKEHVHHIDGNKTNNDLSNLELLSSSEHAIEHARPAKTVVLKCATCETKFERLFRQVTTKLKKGQTDFYCNRNCMAKGFGRGRAKV